MIYFLVFSAGEFLQCFLKSTALRSDSIIPANCMVKAEINQAFGRRKTVLFPGFLLNSKKCPLAVNGCWNERHSATGMGVHLRQYHNLQLVLRNNDNDVEQGREWGSMMDALRAKESGRRGRGLGELRVLSLRLCGRTLNNPVSGTQICYLRSLQGGKHSKTTFSRIFLIKMGQSPTDSWYSRAQLIPDNTRNYNLV